MSNLLLATLAMMGVTFLIGFFVAAVIKIIANWADLLEYYHSHQAELMTMGRNQKQTELQYAKAMPLVGEVTHRKLVHRIHEAIGNLKAHKRVTA